MKVLIRSLSDTRMGRCLASSGLIAREQASLRNSFWRRPFYGLCIVFHPGDSDEVSWDFSAFSFRCSSLNDLFSPTPRRITIMMITTTIKMPSDHDSRQIHPNLGQTFRWTLRAKYLSFGFLFSGAYPYYLVCWDRLWNHSNMNAMAVGVHLHRQTHLATTKGPAKNLKHVYQVFLPPREKIGHVSRELVLAAQSPRKIYHIPTIGIRVLALHMTLTFRVLLIQMPPRALLRIFYPTPLQHPRLQRR